MFGDTGVEARQGLPFNDGALREKRMPVTFQSDPERRRVVVTVPPGTRWAAFESATVGAIEAAPELTDWNWIIDDQGPIDDVGVEGMVRIGETFRRLAREPERPTWTVVVTTDRYFTNWARVIDLNYGARKHQGAPSLAAAMLLMDRLEAGGGPG